MKYLNIFVICFLLCFSCTSESQKLIVSNKSNDNIDFIIIMTDTTETELTIKSNEVNHLYNINVDDIVDIYIEYEGVRDNSYKINQCSTGYYLIENVTPTTYTIKCLLPSDAFNGTDTLFIRYQDRTEQKSITAEHDMITQMRSYDKPRLSKATLNGYPVSLCRQDNQLIIY